jgi:hypothetical protein
MVRPSSSLSLPMLTLAVTQVLALSLDGFWSRPQGAKDLALFRGMAEGDLKDLPSVWHDASLRALQLGEWGGTPRIRTIQCVSLSFLTFLPSFSLLSLRNSLDNR